MIGYPITVQTFKGKLLPPSGIKHPNQNVRGNIKSLSWLEPLCMAYALQKRDESKEIGEPLYMAHALKERNGNIDVMTKSHFSTMP